MAETEGGEAPASDNNGDLLINDKAATKSETALVDEAGDRPAEPDRVAELERELSELREKNEKLQRNLDDALSEICVNGCVRESLVELERQHAARLDEVATLQHLLNEASEESSSTRTRFEHECARLQAIVDQLEHENKEIKVHLKEKNALSAALEGMGSGSGGNGNSGGGLLGAAGNVVDRDSLLAFSDVTKSFARKVKSNFQQTVLLPTSPAHQATSPTSGHANASTVEDDSMKRAYEDAELLKSIVVPLEEQIQALKDKLRQTDALLREHESRQASVILATESLGQWLNGQTTDEALEALQDKAVSPQSALYVGLLVTRLALLTSELDARRREQESVVGELNKSRKMCGQLKQQVAVAQSDLLRAERRHLLEVSRITAVLNPEQKEKLTQASEKVLLAGGGTLTGSVEPETPMTPTKEFIGDIIVHQEDWKAMQTELSRLRSLFGVGLNDGVVGSDAFRKLRAQYDEMEQERDRMAEALSKLRGEIQRESESRKEIEKSWNEKAEFHKTETEALTEKIRELEGIIQNATIHYNVFVKETRKELEPLIKHREKIVAELKRLQVENEKLVGLHEAKSTEMQNEKIDLPDKLEDMQLLLLTLREELINAKVAKEHYEERLKSEVNFIKTQLVGEQQSKEALEDQLTAEIEALREKLCLLESCRTELDAEQKRHREFAEQELRLRQAYAKLQRQNETLETEKRAVEAKMLEIKSRVTILQQELDNSVAVQNDFVRLSQSLQMQLEKIRSESTEVRWQHEDDVDECNNCKYGFLQSARPKRKGHCRHCGKIFCPDCLGKSVTAGPHRRPARVCDVCHTLLVQHSAPYFSTDAPHFNN